MIFNEAIMKAYTFSKEKHSGQFRKFTKDESVEYFIHPKRVSKMIFELTKDTDLAVASLLHDTIEDTDTCPIEIDLMFGKIIRDLVVELTTEKEVLVEYFDGDKTSYMIDKMLDMTSDALTIKLADRYDNIAYLDLDIQDKKHKDFIIKYYSETLDIIKSVREKRKDKTKIQNLLISMIQVKLDYMKFMHLL